MAKRRGLILIFLSLMMAVGAAWVANRWVSGQLVTQADAAPNTQLVVTAAMSIPFATKVEARHVKLTEIPEGVLPENAYTDTVDVEGMVSTTSIARGEILVAERFAAHSRGSTLAALVAPNMRAVTVRVDDVIGVGGFLLPGNTVDVVAARRGRDQRAITETILTNIKVLAVDQDEKSEENTPQVVRAVTLEMTPKQAEKVVKARTEGTIQLTLRNPEEEDVVVAAPVKRAVKKRAPAPVKTDSSVEIIRGTEVKKTKTKS